MPIAAASVTWCDVSACSQEARVTTGPDGRYALTARNARQHVYVRADKPGYLVVQSPLFRQGGAATADLEMKRPGVLFGVVSERTTTGPMPLAGATVTACTGNCFDDGRSQVTASDGRYQFDFEAWSGTVSLFVERNGYQSQRRDVTIAGPVEVNVELNPGTDLCGPREPGPDDLSILSAPFAGGHFVSNYFDHDLPIGSDQNGFQLDTCGTRRAGAIDGHSGYDYVIPTGTALLASASGTIATAGTRGPFSCRVLGGRTVTDQVEVWLQLDEAAGYRVGYLHLSRVNVSAGQRVSRGEVIGYSGNTGCSTGPHLHFEVQAGGRPVDPYGWNGSGSDPWQLHPNGLRSLWMWIANEAPRLGG